MVTSLSFTLPYDESKYAYANSFHTRANFTGTCLRAAKRLVSKIGLGACANAVQENLNKGISMVQENLNKGISIKNCALPN